MSFQSRRWRLGQNKRDLAEEQQIRDIANRVSMHSHYTAAECEAILKMHSNLTRETPIDRMQFRSLLFNALGISDTFILDRIFRVADHNVNGWLGAKEFLQFMSTILRGTFEEIQQFCYNVYDVNGDGSLAREELYMCLEKSLRPGRGIMDADEAHEGVRDIVEIAMRKLDVDRDGQITFDDFKAATKEDPLLLQACGMCLPPEKYARALQCFIAWDYNNVSRMTDDAFLQSVTSNTSKLGMVRVARVASFRKGTKSSVFRSTK